MPPDKTISCIPCTSSSDGTSFEQIVLDDTDDESIETVITTLQRRYATQLLFDDYRNDLRQNAGKGDEKDVTDLGKFNSRGQMSAFRLLMCLSYTLDGFSAAAMIPFYAPAMDIGPALFGGLLTIEAIFRLGMTLVAGSYIHKIQPKRGLLISYAFATLCLVVLGLNPSIENWFGKGAVAVGCFAGLGVALGCMVSTNTVITMHYFPKSHATETCIFETFTAISLVCGPIAAALLLSKANTIPDKMYQATLVSSFKYVGIAGGILCFICLILVATTIKEVPDPKPGGFSEAINLPRKNKSIQLALITLFAGGGLIDAASAMMATQIKSLGIHNTYLYALPLTVYGLVFAVMAPLSATCSTLRPRLVGYMSLMLIILGCVILGAHILPTEFAKTEMFQVHPKYLAIAILLPCYGLISPSVFMASNQEILNAVAGDREPSIDQIVLTTGCWNFGYSVTQIVTPVTFGIIAQMIGYSWAVRSYAIMVALVILPISLHYGGCKIVRDMNDSQRL